MRFRIKAFMLLQMLQENMESLWNTCVFLCFSQIRYEHSYHVVASFVSLATIFLCKIISHSRRCSSFPQKVTLGAAVCLQARSQRRFVATNLLRFLVVCTNPL